MNLSGSKICTEKHFASETGKDKFYILLIYNVVKNKTEYTL